MMKNLGMCLVAVVLLCGCGGPSEMKRVAEGEPILPIREAGDTTEVYLTDYLPSVDLQGLEIQLTEGYDHWTVDTGVVMLYGAARQVGVLSVSKEGDKVDIPILPKLSVAQGLTTAGVTDGSLILQADSISRPLRFRCFVQNVLLPEETVKEQPDGTFSISLKSLPQYKGRSYLRVFASNDSLLLNDLLIPLENGSPVMDAKELTRHDANAQVLYSLLVDRFNNGNKDNDAPLNSPEVDERVDYKGGDLKQEAQAKLAEVERKEPKVRHSDGIEPLEME